MKRIVAVVLFICAVSFGAFAQQFAMGIKEPLAQLQTVDQRAYEKVPVAIVTEKNASILCDGVYLGVWSWAGELTEGEHILTATLPDCQASELSVTVSSAAKNEVFTIPSPERMTGTVEIRGKDGAEVFIYKSGSRTIFKSGFIPYMNESFPTGQYEAVAKKDKYQNSERKSFAVLPDRLVRVDLPQKRVKVVRDWSGTLFETTSDYSRFFIDLGMGVNLVAIMSRQELTSLSFPVIWAFTEWRWAAITLNLPAVLSIG